MSFEFSSKVDSGSDSGKPVDKVGKAWWRSSFTGDALNPGRGE